MASTTTVTSALRTAGGSPNASTRSDTSTTPRSRARHPIRQGTPPTHRYASGAAILPAHVRRPRRRSRPVSRTTTPPRGLERDYEQEFIVGHGHAQIGQLCADLGGPVIEQL